MATKKEVDDIARAVSGAVSSVLSKSRRRYSDESDLEASSRKISEYLIPSTCKRVRDMVIGALVCGSLLLNEILVDEKLFTACSSLDVCILHCF